MRKKRKIKEIIQQQKAKPIDQNSKAKRNKNKKSKKQNNKQPIYRNDDLALELTSEPKRLFK